MPASRFRDSRSRAPSISVAPPLSLLKAATLLAMALSTQFFFQPFVWHYWPVGTVLVGWARVALVQLLLVVPVALALIACGWLRIASAWWRIALLGVAILVGAIVGDQLAHVYLAVEPTSVALLLETLRVALVTASVIVMLAIWRIGMQRTAQAATMRERRAAARAAADLNELEALRRQIEPHFLFNTLATVRELQQSDGPDGFNLLTQLLAFVRQSLASAGSGRARLGDELALVESYLAICRSRMADRLTTRIEVPESLRDAEVPPLILITLVENAIKHGLAPSSSGGSISVAAHCDGSMLELLVADDGVGLGMLDSGAGIGLANSLRRLRLAFGERAGIRLYANHPRGACAAVRLPFELAA